MEFTQDELNVLRNAFNSSDIDGDGVLSKQDIRLTSGLETEEEAEGLFQALKGSGNTGHGENSDVVTFEEFQKSFVDFPFLLEHFKQEYEDIVEEEIITRDSEGYIDHRGSVLSKASNDQDYSITDKSPDQLISAWSQGLTTEEDEFENIVSKKLGTSLFYLRKAIKIDMSTYEREISDDEMYMPYEDEDQVLLDDLQAVSESLSLKIKKANSRNLISDSSNALFNRILMSVDTLVSGVTELHRLNESRTQEQQNKNFAHMEFVDTLKARCDELTEKNRELTVALYNIEEEQMQIQMERVDILSTSQHLQESLDEALKAKENADTNHDQMLIRFAQKEQELLKEQQESRRLRNMKSLQEMSNKLAKPEAAEKVIGFRKQTIAENRDSLTPRHSYSRATISRQTQRTTVIQKQMTLRQEFNERNERQKSTILDWKKQNKIRQLDELKQQLEEQKQKLQEKEEEEVNMEMLNQQIRQLQHINTGLTMQLVAEKNRRKLQNSTKFAEFEESSDEDETQNLQNELIGMSEKTTEVTIVNNDNNQTSLLTHQLAQSRMMNSTMTVEMIEEEPESREMSRRNTGKISQESSPSRRSTAITGESPGRTDRSDLLQSLNRGLENLVEYKDNEPYFEILDSQNGPEFKDAYTQMSEQDQEDFCRITKKIETFPTSIDDYYYGYMCYLTHSFS